MKKSAFLSSLLIVACSFGGCSDEAFDPNSIFEGFEITGQVEGVPFSLDMVSFGGKGGTITEFEAVSSRFQNKTGFDPGNDDLWIDFWLPNIATDLTIVANLSLGKKEFFQWDNPAEGVSVSFNSYETLGKISPQNTFQLDTAYLAETVLGGKLEEVVVVEGKFDCYVYSFSPLDSLRINASFRSFINNDESAF